MAPVGRKTEVPATGSAQELGQWPGCDGDAEIDPLIGMRQNEQQRRVGLHVSHQRIESRLRVRLGCQHQRFEARNPRWWRLKDTRIAFDVGPVLHLVEPIWALRS